MAALTNVWVQDATSPYLFSLRGDQSSIAHGQKFCGLRVAEAFFTTLIFMSLLRFS